MNMKKKNIFISIVIIVFVVGLVVGIFYYHNTYRDKNTTPTPLFPLGVWWWGENENIDKYLEFAKQNGINEIYYSNSSFDESINKFISKANSLNIKVYFLCGEYTWIEDESGFYDIVEKYLEYQQTFENTFSGIHLDVEPHQHPDWKENDEIRKREILASYINFVYNITNADKLKDTTLDFDIPFWLYDYIIDFNGEEKEAYKYIIDYADRVFVMSYRDNAERIFDCAQNELEYSNNLNKKLFLCVETSASSETESVTFYEEGKEYMYQELETLKDIISSNYGEQFQNYGFSIHHMKSWYELID